MRDLEWRPALSSGVPQRPDAAILVEQVPPEGMIALRCDLNDPRAREAVRAATGCPVPEPLRFERRGARSLLWRSPDELLVRCGGEEVAGLLEALAQLLGGTHHSAVDMSDARACFRLRGESARDVLARGAPLDLHRDSFRPGMARFTRIVRVAVALRMLGEGPDSFEVLCFRSYAPWLAEWLLEAARDDSLA